MTEQQSGSRH